MRATFGADIETPSVFCTLACYQTEDPHSLLDAMSAAGGQVSHPAPADANDMQQAICLPPKKVLVGFAIWPP